ncbi:unnamed protein product [Wickerhamomyces anomalus]
MLLMNPKSTLTNPLASNIEQLQPLFKVSNIIMSRGNQREKAREKNAKKQAQQKKKIEGDPKKRLEDQAEIMRKKQAEGEYLNSIHFS